MTHPPSTDELHALIDAQLPPTQRDAVLGWLRDHPETCWELLNWQIQGAELRAHATRIGRDLSTLPPRPAPSPVTPWPEGPTPSPPSPSRLRWLQQPVSLVAGLALVAIGAGWGVQWLLQSRAPQVPGFVREAQFAHAVFTPEEKHPVEVSAQQEQHLVQWLSRRLGRSVQLPDLQAQGYRLMGGRLLPGEGGAPSAQFMFENERAERVTLYLDSRPAASTTPEPRHWSEGGREGFYWVDRHFGYALFAQETQPLPSLARSVWRQLSS